MARFDERTVVKLKTSNRFTGALAECASAVNAGENERFKESIKLLPVEGENWTETLSKEDSETISRVFYRELKESEKPTVCHQLVLDWARCSSRTRMEIVRSARLRQREPSSSYNHDGCGGSGIG